MPLTSPKPASRACDAGPDLKPLFSELVRLETELWNSVESRLRSQHGITLPFFEFMRIISGHPMCRVNDIAAELSITVGGTSKIVDRIEAAGYCARRTNPRDRRSSVIMLTPAGQRLLPEITATVDDALRTLLGSEFSDRSLTRLSSTLTRLRASVRSAGAG